MGTTRSLKSRFAAVGATALCIFSFSASVDADPSGQARGVHRDVAASSTVKGSCVSEKQAFASSATPQITASATMTNVAGAIIKPTITQGCLVVDFTADSFAPFGNILYVQVLLDGTAMTPGLVQLSGNDDPSNSGFWVRSHSFSFVATGLSSGQHTLQVQFGNQDNTHPVYIQLYTLVAHYD